ncbi:MAG: MarC family protein, partial [Xanthobacteraceae bacterium]
EGEAAEQAMEERVRNVAAFPLAIPLLAGPGAIAIGSTTTNTVTNAEMAKSSSMTGIHLSGFAQFGSLLCHGIAPVPRALVGPPKLSI